MEIERKFLIKRLPEGLDTYEHHEISQGYISTYPVMRIRQLDESYILTMKSSGLLTREEYEMSISKEEFDNLTAKVDGNVIMLEKFGELTESWLEGDTLAATAIRDAKPLISPAMRHGEAAVSRQTGAHASPCFFRYAFA